MGKTTEYRHRHLNFGCSGQCSSRYGNRSSFSSCGSADVLADLDVNIELGPKGVNIFRFANCIPLLFEQGADVVTRTALKRINWNSYKINPGQDKIGVFVSIVSTKIPFKGTGKEYIGDDITEISSAVKTAIQQCCNQLKAKIMKKLQDRERHDRKRNLTR